MLNVHEISHQPPAIGCRLCLHEKGLGLLLGMSGMRCTAVCYSYSESPYDGILLFFLAIYFASFVYYALLCSL